MSRVTEAGMDGALEGDVQRMEQRAVGEREVRWSARRKEGVVMRRGCPIRRGSSWWRSGCDGYTVTGMRVSSLFAV
jgi:hypothetical protein